MKKLLFGAIFALIFSSTQAQKIPLNAKLPMDPSVKMGKLPNGLSYYIKKNSEPKNRAQLRLVVKAGSILEDENQRGLAHFMEHMNFNGTKHFQKNELVNFLEKSGIKFGADLNAYTSFDETVYMLPVPTDTISKLEKFVMVLADWANNATLEHSEIDKERGVVLEESRLRKGAQTRIQNQLLPVIFRGSKYADRLPIGLDSIIQNAPYQSIEKFYKDWYRPDLEGFIAVGDFDVNVMEAMVKKYFGAIKPVKNPKKRENFSVPLKGGTDAVVITDKEQPYNMIQLYYLQPEKKQITGNDRRENMIISLFNDMISQRLQELLRKADPPYQYGASNYSGFLGNLDALQVFAVAKGADVEKAITTVLTENERALKYGFTEGEFNRAKENYKTQVEKQFKEKDKTESESYVDELVGDFKDNVVMTSQDFDLKFTNQELPGIKLSEVNDLVKKIITKENRVLALIGSEKDKDKFPTAEKLKALLDNHNENVSQYVDEAATEPLVKVIPNAGKIATETKIADINVTKITFENGVNVYLKPTDFKNDEIKFRGNSWGGMSLYDNSDFYNVSLASSVANASGIGNYKVNQLQKYLSGKIANVNAIVGPNSEVITGSSSTKDFETALQMIYSRFTNNHLDTAAAKGFLNNQRDFLLNMEKTPNPEKVYRDTLQAVMGNYNFRSLPMKADNFDKVQPEKAMEFFNQRFADISDFDFTFVGNFDIEKIKPLLAEYLGGIPTKKVKEQFNDRKILPPTGIVNKVVKKGTEDKATVSLIYAGAFDGTENQEQIIDALGEILSIKLTEKLREEEGNVYSPHVSAYSSFFPSPRYQFRIGFGCSPANVDKLINLTNAEIDKIKTNGASQVDIEKYITNKKLGFQTDLKTNDFWLNEIASKVQKNENLSTILTEDKTLNFVTIENTKTAANQYLSGKDVIKVILLPEDKK